MLGMFLLTVGTAHAIAAVILFIAAKNCTSKWISIIAWLALIAAIANFAGYLFMDQLIGLMIGKVATAVVEAPLSMLPGA
jgi:hypothetical protein